MNSGELGKCKLDEIQQSPSKCSGAPTDGAGHLVALAVCLQEVLPP